MKKQYLYLIFLYLIFSFKINAQFNKGAPWMQDLQKKSSKEKYTLTEISNAFNLYWDNHQDNIDKKGSGYKPFKRWENRWDLSTDKNGYIINPNKIWDAWHEKNILQNRSPNDISNWQNIGPFTQESKSGQGRVNTIIVDPIDPDVYYIGAPAGGIWKSTDQGENWEPLSDNLPQIGVSGIAIDYTDTNIIYIATGDDDAGDTYSVGVLKSTDGGTTWNTTGLQFLNFNERSNEIYIHPTNPQILWVATSDGLYKTTNAGSTWIKKRSGNIRDLKIHPTNPNIIYAVSSSVFYKSINGGDTFSTILSGLPNSSNRLAIEVTPANPNLVFVLSADGGNNFQGLYKSTNSGSNFNRTNEFDDIFNSSQSWYDMSLTVSDTDEDIIFVGVLDIWKSTNGGDNFFRLNQWFNPSGASYTHADIHFLRYFNGDLFCGSDGGIYKSTNNGNVFNELNEGLAISQYYRIAVSKQTANNVVGGLQDNGGFAYSNNTWYKYHGGDGMDCAIDPNNPNRYYGFTQYGGSLNATQNGGVSGQGVTSSPENGNWITPLTINSQGELYAGYSHLYKLVNSSWQQISGNVFGGRVHRVEIDPNNENTIYVGRSNTLFKSTNSGFNFTQIYTTSNGNSISSVEVNNDNSNIIYLTTSSVNGQILKSTNGGTSFFDITGNLPSESKLIIKHQIHSPSNDLYIGTSLGVYHINDTMADWEVFSTNLPNVPVRDLEININDRIITAGTYGRSVWQSSIEVTPPSNDVRLVAINNPSSSANCGTEIPPEILVKNEGTNTITAVTINYIIDGTSLNFTYNGSIAPQATQLITLPNLTGLTVGEHQLSVETTIVNDAYNDNNNSIVSFFTTQFDPTPTNVNPFESNTDEWLVTGLNTWEIGVPTTAILDGNGSGYVTRKNGDYFNNTTSYLISPCYDLTQIQGPVLKFDMKFELELNYDVMYVEYSTSSNNTWEVLGTADDTNWYNSSFASNSLTIGSQWTGTDATLKEYSYNLASLANETEITFRFSFLTDGGLTAEGVFIDNFVIQSIPLGIEDNLLTNFTIYPNPSTGIFTLQRNSEKQMQITIYDITGKIIHTENNISESKYQLDLNTYEKGIYFLKLEVDNTKIIKKLILK